MSWVFIFWANLSKSVCVPRGREDRKRHKSSVLGFHSPPSLLFPELPVQRAHEKEYMVLEEESSEPLHEAAARSPPHQALASPFMSCTGCDITIPITIIQSIFLLTVLRTKGESSESKVKEDEMTYFLGYFCADEKLILIKPTLKSFQPTFSQGHTLLDKQG